MAQYFPMNSRAIDMAWIWNVNGVVSPYAYSARPDVMLVQHALNTVMAQLSLVDGAGQEIHYLHRDGYMGPKTNAAIASFQKYLRQHGRLVKADGSVDPASAEGWTRDGNAQYTIIWLNRKHREIHGTMMKEKDFPELLKADVKKHAQAQGIPLYFD